MPQLYILLGDKTQATYQLAFNFLASKITTHPRSILVDFEKGAINALKIAFPNTRIKGCYFHLTQSLWRKTATLGLSKNYKRNSDFAKAFGYLKCLAFLKPEDVVPGFEFIRTFAPAICKPLLDYFEKYYIGTVNPRNDRERSIPWFPIELWSVYQRVLNDEPRTNNSTESWHKSLAVRIFYRIIYLFCLSNVFV